MKKTDTRALVPPLPPARPTTSRAQAFRATALREVRRRPPTVARPGMFVPHFSQRRTVSRGACICSSASRSRRRFPTAAAAPPAPALPIARWPACSMVAAPSADRPRFPRSRRRPSARRRPRPIHSGALVLLSWRVVSIDAAPLGRPTAMSIERRPPAAAERPRRVSPRQRGTHAPSFFPHMRRTGGKSLHTSFC